ncbi:uncharacterized protein N0V89_006361 [Didymosphaeria variabile]|uniref:NAD(P)-binding protein n=1 Tax=Didymosphaeria variabile TaxID=1932322 RepID=A0A9W9CCC3_9PLEO|nr:uncharacterized protein N0V89_006361 [Didymosphaeria variabile]KAJ4354624.1 hypothetical protein N0V89_006361 [Didymosphaeria variabile]
MGTPGFFIAQLRTPVPQLTTSFAGKTVIVTGSNVGLGLEAARDFTRNGASKVILAVRSLSKGEAAKRDIETSTGNKNVEVWQLDQSSYQSVLDFADRAEKELQRLDAVVLNAGISAPKWEVYEQDESTLTVNVVSTFLLLLALLPKLNDTANKFNTRPIVTVVASAMHGAARFAEKDAPEGKIFEALNTEHNGGVLALQERYNLTKLLDVLLAREIADRLSSSNSPVIVNSVCPGFCASELARDVTGVVRVVYVIMKALLARTSAQGGRTLSHAASQGPEGHGKYFSNFKITEPSPFVRSPEGQVVQRRVWDGLKKYEVIRPGITAGL